MPNGGVPMHMILYPKDGSQYVLYCQGGSLRIFAKEEWQRNKVKGVPLLTLTNHEGAAIGWFLKYWLGEHALRPGYDMKQLVQSEYDF